MDLRTDMPGSVPNAGRLLPGDDYIGSDRATRVDDGSDLGVSNLDRPAQLDRIELAGARVAADATGWWSTVADRFDVSWPSRNACRIEASARSALVVSRSPELMHRAAGLGGRRQRCV